MDVIQIDGLEIKYFDNYIIENNEEKNINFIDILEIPKFNPNPSNKINTIKLIPDQTFMNILSFILPTNKTMELNRYDLENNIFCLNNLKLSCKKICEVMQKLNILVFNFKDKKKFGARSISVYNYTTNCMILYNKQSNEEELRLKKLKSFNHETRKRIRQLKIEEIEKKHYKFKDEDDDNTRKKIKITKWEIFKLD